MRNTAKNPRFGKLPLCALIARQRGHKKSVGAKELESEYYADRLLEFDAQTSRNIARLYKTFEEYGFLLPPKDYKLVREAAMVAAHMKIYPDETKPSKRINYKKYFKNRGVYL